jgi:hypothetical protein
MRKVGAGSLGAVVGLVALGAVVAAPGRVAREDSTLVPARGYAHLPLAFEENRGQYAREIRYVAHGAGATLAVRDRDVSIAFATGPRLRLRFAAPATHPSAAASGRLPGRTNYLLGSNSRNWLRNVSTFPASIFAALRPGSTSRSMEAAGGWNTTSLPDPEPTRATSG